MSANCGIGPSCHRAAAPLRWRDVPLPQPKEPPMCHELDSEPPIPAIAGAAISHEDVVLDAADGGRFAGFLATPDEPSRVGVVILPDVRGLYHFYEELALRFAERGYAALAIDYFGRSAAGRRAARGATSSRSASASAGASRGSRPRADTGSPERSGSTACRARARETRGQSARSSGWARRSWRCRAAPTGTSAWSRTRPSMPR